MPRSYVEKYQGIFNGNIASTSTGTGTLVVTGGIGTNGRVSANDVVISATTASTSTSTGALTISGGVGVSGNIYVGGSTASTSTSTGTLVVTGGVGIGGNLNVGGTFTVGTLSSTDLTVSGNLVVNGTTTTINSTTITVDDVNIELGSVATPTDTTANGGGITLKGATDKTIIWDSTNSNWTSSEHWNIASGKAFKINNTNVLTSTQLGSAIAFSSNTASTSTGTGTLVVTGGVGVSGSINARGFGIGGYRTAGVWGGPTSIVTNPTMKLGSRGEIGGYNGNDWTNATSASTSTDTGTLVVEGGVGISGCLNIGGYVTNTVLANGSTVGNTSFGVGQSSTSTNTGTLVVTGGVGVSENINASKFISGPLSIKNSDIFADPLVAASGINLVPGDNGSVTIAPDAFNGFANDVYEGGSGVLTNANPTSSTSTDSGALIVIGGVGVSGNINSGGTVNKLTGNTASTTTATGTLVVTGGVGISGNLNVGGVFNVGALNSTDLTVSGNLTVNGATTTINSSTITVDDKNIELGSVPPANISTTGTVGSITGSGGGPWDCVITNMTSTKGLIEGSIVTATDGTGRLHALNNAGVVTGILSSTSVSVRITSTANDPNDAPSNGTITDITSAGPSDTTANGGGITVLGSTNKTLNWSSTGNNWTSNQNFDLSSTKVYKINNTQVLSSTQLGSAINFSSNTASTSTGTGTLVVTGGVGVSGRVSANNIQASAIGNVTAGSGAFTTLSSSGATTMTAAAASTSTETGTLVVTGGVGVSGNINTSGRIVTTDQTGYSLPPYEAADASISTNGGIHCSTILATTTIASDGSISAEATASFGGGTATQSTSTSTGTLVVYGGIGVSGVIHCKGIKTNKLNPGVTLIDGATPSPRISIKFPVNFKDVAENSMFIVPTDCMFLIDSMEIITTSITSPGTAPTVRLGNTSTANAYYGPTLVTSNSVGARHIIENPQDGVAAGTTVTCGVTSASTASAHTGFIKINGELIYLNDTGTGVANNVYLDGCANYGPGSGAL